MNSETSSEKNPQEPRQSQGLRFKHVFTNKNTHPFDTVRFEKRSCHIANLDGTSVFEHASVEVPQSWSQLASDILASKYFRRTGVIQAETGELGGETSLKQVISRVTAFIRKAGEQQSIFKTPEDAEIFEMELTHLLLHQKGSFNSPVWFNCGLFQAYGIEGSGGNCFWNAATGQPEESQNAFEYPQCSACFIQSVDDSLMSIYDLLKSEARLFKFGSGSGTNFSRIRGKQEALSGGGFSSGLMSFLDVLDRSAGATKSGGTVRRAAKMVCLDMDHPEIMDFIQWKQREESKVKALIDAGYSSDFNGEAYQTVSGQNANNSVRLSDRFMESCLNHQPWQTTFRTTGEVCETLSADGVLRHVAQSAWACADPGVQFDDTINRWNTCLETDRIYGSNPCSEFHFLDDTACNLASINLLKFLTPSGEFNIEQFRHACRIFLVAQEILIDSSSYPTSKIAQNSHDYRPLGLGYANLGALLMVNGIAYDSSAGLSFTAVLTAIMTGEAYRTSAEMASVQGAFPKYEQNKTSMQRVLLQHQEAVSNLALQKRCPAVWMNAARTVWSEALTLGGQFGYRNAQTTVIAPTGTIGLLMDCDTTGIEPEFSLIKWKKLAGGGYFKIINQSVPRALRHLKYNEQEIREMLEHLNVHETLENAPYLKPKHISIFDCATQCGNGVRFIRPLAHVNIMAAAQPFLSGAISKTVNLPEDASVDDILQIYTAAWRMGLKGVAVYRNNSKFSQPLNHSKQALDKPASLSAQKSLAWGDFRTFPDKRQGVTLESSIHDHDFYLRTGEFDDGQPGEVFINMFKEDITYQSLVNCFAMSVSIGLQYGVPLERFVTLFTSVRFEPSGRTEYPAIPQCTSIIDFIFRFLQLEYLTPDNQDITSETVEHHENKENRTPAPVSPEPTLRNQNSVSLPASDNQAAEPSCSHCGHATHRIGTCYTCTHCGHSDGCA